jgi:hypothetical protein
MPVTYESIATTTLGSTTGTVTFSSIPGTYTDLVLVVDSSNVNSTAFIGLVINSETGNVYSSTRLYGDGSSASSDRYTNRSSSMIIGTAYETSRGTNIIQLMNYSNTTTNKTILNRDNGTGLRVGAIVGLWRSTAAITNIDVVAPDSTGFTSGSTFTLYGIKAFA